MFNNTEGEYGKYIVQELKYPKTSLGTPEFQAMYNKFSNRILWMDTNVVEGAFQMNTAWYHSVPEKDPVFEEHEHDYDELIGFYSSDPSNPNELGAVLELGINGEMHRIDKTSMIFIPSGMKHMPLRIVQVDRPIFHFSVVMSPEYSGETAYK